MNLVNVGSLLGNIKASDVRYGAHAIERANGNLPLDYHLSTDCTGEEVLRAIEGLSDEAQEALKSANVLSPAEMQTMVADISSIKLSDQYALDSLDRKVRSMGTIYAVVLSVIAIFATALYVFTVSAEGDSLGGVVYTAAEDLWSSIPKVLNSGGETPKKE